MEDWVVKSKLWKCYHLISFSIFLGDGTNSISYQGLIDKLDEIGKKINQTIGIWACICYSGILESSCQGNFCQLNSKKFDTINNEECLEWLESANFIKK
jgi:hypothetical protein